MELRSFSNQAIDAVHLKGRRYGKHGRARPPKHFENITDRHIRAVRHTQIRPLHAKILSQKPQKTLRFRIRCQKFRRQFRLYFI